MRQMSQILLMKHIVIHTFPPDLTLQWLIIWASESILKFNVFILVISRFLIWRSRRILGRLTRRYWQYFLVFFFKNFSWENLVFWLKLELLSTSFSIILDPSILCSCIDSISSLVSSWEQFSSTKFRLSSPLV